LARGFNNYSFRLRGRARRRGRFKHPAYGEPGWSPPLWFCHILMKFHTRFQHLKKIVVSVLSRLDNCSSSFGTDNCPAGAIFSERSLGKSLVPNLLKSHHVCTWFMA
jgi:hypothetical protein